jgi:uncharacterized membrane protein required for colicin V production
MADAVIGVVLVLGLVGGLRRGFFKEAIAVLSILVATWVAIHAYGAAGPMVAEKLKVGADAGFLVGGIAAWILAYIASVLVGNLVWKALRGKGPLQSLQNVGEGAADAAAGDTRPGPVTLLLKPLPTRAGILYWIDKVLGAALGIAQAALLVVVVLFAAQALPLGKTGEVVRKSSAFALFRTEIEPRIAQIPEVKVVTSIGDMSQVIDDVKGHPERAEWLRESGALDPVRTYEPFRALKEDEVLRKAFKERRWSDVLSNDKIIGLLKDREFLRRLSSIDWQKIRDDMHSAEEKEAKERAPAAPKPDAPKPESPKPEPKKEGSF